MKFRRDFVTNSSSSSYVCVSKINMCDEFVAYMKEEFGRYGLRLLGECLVSGKEIKENKGCDYDEILDFFEEEGIAIENDNQYLQVLFYEWSTEGDENGDDAFLYEHIPDRFKEEIYRGCTD